MLGMGMARESFRQAASGRSQGTRINKNVEHIVPRGDRASRSCAEMRSYSPLQVCASQVAAPGETPDPNSRCRTWQWPGVLEDLCWLDPLPTVSRHARDVRDWAGYETSHDDETRALFALHHVEATRLKAAYRRRPASEISVSELMNGYWETLCYGVVFKTCTAPPPSPPCTSWSPDRHGPDAVSDTRTPRPTTRRICEAINNQYLADMIPSKASLLSQSD